jgi:Fe-S-cluster containining protein
MNGSWQAIHFSYLCPMSLEEKVRAVETVFDSLDKAIASFQASSGLHCKAGCGKCCFKPDIEATALEFLPFAYHLYKHDKCFEWLNRLMQQPSGICTILNPLQAGVGLCSQYTHRGLICRLFGYSARTNKYNQKELITCQVIKTEQSENYEKARATIAQGGNVPVMNQFYMQLHAIDMELSREFFPINRAIQRAIESVLHYYAYR